MLKIDGTGRERRKATVAKAKVAAGRASHQSSVLIDLAGLIAACKLAACDNNKRCLTTEAGCSIIRLYKQLPRTDVYNH